MKRNKKIYSLILLIVLLAACSQAPAPTSNPTGTAGVVNTIVLPSPSPLPSETMIPSATMTAAPTSTSTSTSTPTLTASPQPSPIPTYIKLRGEVIPAQAVCHYGPGAPYLYKYGVVAGSNLEIIARNDDTGYLEVQAIGGNNPCWVNAKWMQVKGNLEDVAPIKAEEIRLPQSPYYGALTYVSAKREGNEVSISWSPLVLKAGDSSEQYPYLVEAWVCQNGQTWFTPVGSYQTTTTIADSPGCSTPSHGRVYGVEKHGYTRWLEIPWPQP